MKTRLPLASIIFLTIGFWLYLWSNRHHFTIPDTDIFQYIWEGQHYVELLLPPSIHAPPLFSFLINFFSTVFGNLVAYPELFFAHLLNITASSLNLLFIYLLLRRHLPLLAAAIPWIVATNKIYILYSLDVPNVIFYIFTITLVFYLYFSGRRRFALTLSGFLFLLRYESLALTLVLLLIHYRFHRPEFRPGLVASALLPMVVWLVVLNFHSTGTNLTQNAYINEIKNGYTTLPNFNPYLHLIDLVSYQPSVFIQRNRFFLIIFMTVLSMKLLYYRHLALPATILLFTMIHLLSLAMFPNFAIRNLLPILWPVYFSLLFFTRYQFTILAILPLAFISLYNLPVKTLYDRDSKEMSEYRLAAEWLNRQNLNQKSFILIYNHGVFDYFTTNPQIRKNNWIEPEIYSQCRDKLDCVAEYQHRLPEKYQVYTITTSFLQQEKNNPDTYTTNQLHLPAYNDLIIAASPRFKLINIIDDGAGHWAKIYVYLPPGSVL